MWDFLRIQRCLPGVAAPCTSSFLILNICSSACKKPQGGQGKEWEEKEKNTANSKCFESSYPILLGTKCQWAE